MAINYGSHTVTSSVFQGTDKVISGTVETLYFYGGTDWANTSYWWTDSAHTIAAGRLPNETDNVILLANLSSNTGNVAKCANLVVGNYTIAITISVGSNINKQCTLTSSSNTITVSNTTGLFEGMRVEGIGIPVNTVITGVSANTSIIISNNTTSNGSAKLSFYGQAYFTYYNNAGHTINGDAYFNSVDNSYTVNGKACFNGSSARNAGGTVNGDAIFSDSSYNQGNINGNVSFYTSSHNDTGTIVGDVSFIEPDANTNIPYMNGGTIIGNVTCTGYSYVGGTIIGNVTCTGHSYVSGTIIGNAVFRNYSYNDGNITGDVVFLDTTYLNGGTIVGNVTMLNSSYTSASATVHGSLSFYNTSYLGAAITVLGDISFHGGSYVAGIYDITCSNFIWNSTINSSIYNTDSTIYGNAIFLSGVLGAGGGFGTPVITGNLTLKNSSYIIGSINVYIGGTVTFDDSSYIDFSSSLYCPNVIINTTINSTNTVNYYSNVVVNSNVGVSSASIYGDLTLNNGSYSNGSNSIYYGKLILKNSSYIASSTGVTFYGESQLILDNFDNTTDVSSASINDNDNALTIIVNSKIPSHGWMFHGSTGTNYISCRTLIFNAGPGACYYSGTNVLDAAKVVFNDTCYWDSSGSLSGSAAPVKIVFNDESYNDGTAGDSNSLAEFNDSSYNDGTIAGRAIFNDYSENRASCTVNGDAVFNDFSINFGIIGDVNADAVFNDFSVNETGGDVNGSAYYYSASPQSGTDEASYYPAFV